MLKRALALVAILLLVLAGAALWLLKTPQGARFALERATRMAGGGVTYHGLEGSLGGPMRIGVLEVSRPGMYARVEDFEMDASPFKPLAGSLHVYRLSARSVEVRTLDTGEAAKLPTTFAPPLEVRLDEGRVGELRMGPLTREAAAEKDPKRKRELIEASRDNDLVVRNILLRGEGDEREWRIGEARAETAYGKAHIAGRVQSAAPFAIDLKAALEGVAAGRPYKADAAATGSLKAIDAKVDGQVSGQPARLRAAIEPFASMPVRMLEATAQDVDLARHAAGPRTRLAIEVKLAGEGKAFAGPVRIENAEAGAWDRGRLPVASASGRVVVTAEQLDLPEVRLVLAGGGTAAGRATLRRSGAQAELAIADVDLAALHGELQKTRVTGRVSVAGDRAAQRFEVALRGLPPTGTGSNHPRFELEGRAALANQRLAVDTATVRTGGGSVTATGAMAFSGNREFRFEGRAQHFDPSAFVKAAKGDLNLSFVAAGALAPEPAGEARVEIAPSTFAGLAASGRVNLAGDKRRVSRADVDVMLGDARIAARGSFGGRNDALDVTLRAPNLAALARPFQVAASGKLDAQARLTGTFQAPAGRVTLTGANLVLPANLTIRELALRAEAGTEPDSPIDASVQAAGVTIAGDEPVRFADKIDASLKGTRLAHRFAGSADMTRETTLRIALDGGLDPRARSPIWKGRIESFAMTGPGAFALAAPAALEASAQKVELGEATLKGTWGEARMQVARWTPRTLDLKGSSPGIEIQNLARSLRLAQMPRSNLVVAGDWDIRAAESFNGTLTLRRVSGDLRVGEPPLPLGLRTLDLKAEAVQGRARATFLVEGERAGRIQGEGAGQIARGTAGWQLAPAAQVQARVVADHTNLEALAPWLGTDARLGGRLNANVTVSGTGAEPRIAGEARAVDFAVREPQSGFEGEQGQLAVRLEGRSLAIQQLSLTTPWKPAASAREHLKEVSIPASGTLTGEGSIDLQARKGAITFRAHNAVLTQTSSRFLAISGEARLQAGEKGLAVTGSLKADAGWVGALDSAPPAPSEDVVVVRAAAPPASAKEPGSEPIRIDMRFSLGDHMYFEGRGLDTRLAGDIHVSGPPTALRAVGTIRTLEGTYKGYGQKLVVERGVLRFSGPIENPQLSVLALRKGLAVEAGVEVTGSVRRPRVRLVSMPDVPEPEKLSWLVLGRGPSELAPGDASVLLAAATSMLGGSNPGSDLGQKLGLDEVKIGRADTNAILGVLPQSTVAGKTGSASAAEVVSVGKRLTRNVHLTYEQGLADAEGALKVAWQITQRFQLLVRAGFLPGIDAVYRWTLK